MQEVIITGAPRSGTTGMQIALSALPGCCVWYEFDLYSVADEHPARMLMDRCRRFIANKDTDGPEPKGRVWEHPMLLRHPLIRSLPLHVILHDVGQLKDEPREALRDYLLATAALHKGPLRLYGDKSPMVYASRLVDTMKAHPEVKVIYCLRDGRDVVASRSQRGDNKSLEWCCQMWLDCVAELGRAVDDPALRERIRIVKLEEAAQGVGVMFCQVAAHTGLVLKPGDLETFKHFYRPVHIGRWRAECPDVEDVGGSAFRTALQRWGYK